MSTEERSGRERTKAAALAGVAAMPSWKTAMSPVRPITSPRHPGIANESMSACSTSTPSASRTTATAHATFER